jgi:hypothetical protein
VSASQSAAAATRAARKKPPSAGRGRKKGELNHTTRDVRTMIAMVAEKNAHKLDAWLTKVGKRNPAQAIDLYLRMIEYHIPKLSRQEIVKPPPGAGRVIDSSKLTAEEREQMRQIILRQMQPPEPVLIEQQQPNMLEPVGLGDAQVVERGEIEGDSCHVSSDS